MSEYPYDYDESAWNIVRELEKVILSRPDGIVLSANQYTSETIQELLLRAKAQGIKILLCDSDAEAPMRDCFVGSDNVESGKNAARLAAEKTDSGEILVFIESDEKDSRAAQTRLDAFRAETGQ